MLRRPDDVFDREEEWRALERFCDNAEPGATLGVVSGRRRQGKSFLLEAVSEQTRGFYFQATEGTAAESLRSLGDRLGRYLGAPAPLALGSLEQAVDVLLSLGSDEPRVVVLDEFPYLKAAVPVLPSVIQAAFGPRRRERLGSRTRLILCGSSLSVMGELLSGAAPLRGRAALELVVPTFDYRTARQFWAIEDPSIAALTYAVVGGTPAYREWIRGDQPDEDFDDWVLRTVLDPSSPLMKEARYLLNEEAELRDRSLYHSVLAAVAEGHTTRGGIASHVGRKTTALAHPLTVLEDAGFLVKEEDVFRERRPVWRVAEPIVGFYHAIMRPYWAQLERPGRASAVWEASRPAFSSLIVGPLFEQLCRTWAERYAPPGALGGIDIVEVGHGVVNDPARKAQHELDVVALGRHGRGRRRVVSIGEAKWGELMGIGHLTRLERIRELLDDTGRFQSEQAVLACYSAQGFNDKLQLAAAERDDVCLIDLDQLYGT